MGGHRAIPRVLRLRLQVVAVAAVLPTQEAMAQMPSAGDVPVALPVQVSAAVAVVLPVQVSAVAAVAAVPVAVSLPAAVAVPVAAVARHQSRPKSLGSIYPDYGLERVGKFGRKRQRGS
jgi:hypothetical protein